MFYPPFRTSAVRDVEKRTYGLMATDIPFAITGELPKGALITTLTGAVIPFAVPKGVSIATLTEAVLSLAVPRGVSMATLAIAVSTVRSACILPVTTLTGAVDFTEEP